jgi:hypothetical protein
MSKAQGFPPGQKLPKGAVLDKSGRVRLPKQEPVVKRIVVRLPRDKR